MPSVSARFSNSVLYSIFSFTRVSYPPAMTRRREENAFSPISPFRVENAFKASCIFFFLSYLFTERKMRFLLVVEIRSEKKQEGTEPEEGTLFMDLEIHFGYINCRI